METRISGLLDAPRLGGVQTKLDTENKAQSSPPLASQSMIGENGADAKVIALSSAKSQSELLAAVSDMNDFVQSVNRNIDFQLDDDSGKVVVSITDRETGGIIRQIPSEEALKLAESLSEARSLLFNTEA
ncbi:flagellar protein FlaG [Halopseudomonas laoshanensis]|uniref:flagellar protein FlaG n=1 Tax=Halopseudomonas laoshanensis TaxID=2268758 RepID=UPI003734F137